MSMLRSNSSTEKFHENSNGDSSTSQNTKFEASSLSRRLVSSSSDQGNAYERQNKSAQSPSKTRFLDQSREIYTLSELDHNLHRGSFCLTKRHCFSNSTGNIENTTSNSASETRVNSSKLSSCVGPHDILHRSSPSCTSVHENSTAASVAFLETSIEESRNQNSNQRFPIRPFELVAKERKLTSGSHSHL